MVSAPPPFAQFPLAVVSILTAVTARGSVHLAFTVIVEGMCGYLPQHH